MFFENGVIYIQAAAYNVARKVYSPTVPKVCANPITVIFPITLKVTNPITEMHLAHTMGPRLPAQCSAKNFLVDTHPIVLIPYLTQNVTSYVEIHVRERSLMMSLIFRPFLTYLEGVS